MKVKTSELSGVQLDYAVAWSVDWGQPVLHITSGGSFVELMGVVFSPTSNWSQCGPLIEQFKLTLYLHTEYEINGEGVYDVYEAGCSADWFVDASTPDPVSTDPKIAICRAVVASKLGDEVDIPDELMEMGE